MGLFGKSKKDKVDNAMHLIDNRTRKYSKVRYDYLNRKPDDRNLDPRILIQETMSLLDAMLLDLYNIRRHLG